MLADFRRSLPYRRESSGTVGTVADALSLLDSTRATPPDVLLVDINLPGLNGFEATTLLRRELPRAGFSTFAYIKQRPGDIIKIDGSFIRDLLNDPMSHAIVRAVTDIGHQRGLQVVAEWVASEEILQALVALGVAMEFAQARLTRVRLGDVRDALANTLGVAVGLSLTFTPLQFLLERVDRKLFRRD